MVMRTSFTVRALVAAAALAGAPLAAQDAAVATTPARPLTLGEVVSMAQRQGLVAQAARSGRDAARLRDRAFDARLLPQLSLAGDMPSLDRSITPVIQPDGTTLFHERSQMQSSLRLVASQPVPFAGGELYVSSALTRMDLLGDESSRYWQSTPLIVGWQQEIFRPRDRLWDGREQDMLAEIAEREYREAREEIAERAAAAYFDVHAAAIALGNAETNVAVNDSLYALSKGRYEVGKIGENELLQNELALLQARAAVDAASLQHERALAALRLELDLPDDTPISIAPPPPPPTGIQASPDLAAAEAVRRGSRTGELELGELRARRRVTEARLSNGFGATLRAEVGFNQTAPVLGEAYESLLNQQRLGFSVAMPIVQWGGGRAEVQAALAEQSRQASLDRAARRTIAQEGRFAARELALAERQLVLAAKADTVAAKRFEVAKNRYVIGRIDIGDLFIAQSEKDNALRAYVNAERGYWVAYYRLRRLTLYDFERGVPIGEGRE